jgi:hypothetical protein
MGFSEGLEVILTWISTVFKLDVGEMLFVSSAHYRPRQLTA